MKKNLFLSILELLRLYNSGEDEINQVPSEGRHSCPTCGRSYKNRKHMLCHFRNECSITKRFSCPYCNKRYTQRAKVWRHVLPAHPNKELFCIDIVTNNILFKNAHS